MGTFFKKQNSKPLILSWIFILSGVFNASGQYETNFGLSFPQDPATLPKSLVPLQRTIRKEKIKAGTIMQAAGRGEWIISDGWEMMEASGVVSQAQDLFSPGLNTTQWYNATVPGTVLSTLVDQGVYPDPFYGLNNLIIPDTLCRMDWWYRNSFTVPDNAGDKNIWLLFNGINYQAEIWFNGKLIGTMAGAFRRREFDITEYVRREGSNVLAVHILPPPNPGIPHEQSILSGKGPNGGQLCLDGPTFISSEGWDWVPGIRDRNIGIWQDVRILSTGAVRIMDPQILTDLLLPDTSLASLTIRTGLYNHSGDRQKVMISCKIEDVYVNQEVILEAGQHKTVLFSPEQYPQLKIKNPRLWWPNGYGNPELYNMELTIEDENHETSDSRSVRFGIRELSYEMSVDTPFRKGWRMEFNPVSANQGGKPLFDNTKRRQVVPGTWVSELRDGIDPNLLAEAGDTATAPYLVVKVNGVRIFCKGGNWGMDHAMKRTSREFLEPFFRLHRGANFNMVRNWTGESTEEIFYDLCDEYGLLVWNDFWLSTEGYNLNVNDERLFMDNAMDVIRRFRNHPSIAVWCPRNEGYAPPVLEEMLSQCVARLDGTRLYQANSRYLNLRPSGPWDYFQDAADYFRNNASGFNTEQGTPSVPTAESMRKMMAAEDLWPIGDVWCYHDFHGLQKGYQEAIERCYGKASSLEDFCKKAQMINYDSHRAMFESWNSRLWNNTTGLLVWMSHPAWPSTVWQVYSWDYETFGSYFGSKKACEPVHVQMNLHNDELVVANTSRDEIKNASVKLICYDLRGKELYREDTIMNIPPNQLSACFTPCFPAGLPGAYLARLKLTDHVGRMISINEYWRNASGTNNFLVFNHLPIVRLDGKILKEQCGEQNQVLVKITNPSETPAIAIKLNLRDSNSGERILPAYFSDGYFTLIPGESREIQIQYRDGDGESLILTCDGYNVVNQSIICYFDHQ